MRLVLSNYQYSFLSDVYEKRGYSLQQMLASKQTTAGSVVRKNFLEWVKPIRRFMVTEAGKEALKVFYNTDTTRKNRKGKLSEAIEAKWNVNRDSLVVTKRRAAAA